MEKTVSDRLIADAAKTLFSYCRIRTGGKEEAEDLSQDILLELLRTRGNLRDGRAFYGFMWAVAGNVYKNWCKKRAKPAAAELGEDIIDGAPPLDELLEGETDLRLLRRELGLLGEQYRRVTVLYYFDGRRVHEISAALGISESMVKFLLFKSRKILKEGMDMERTNGELSFNPGKVALGVLRSPQAYTPGAAQQFWDLVNDNLIAQNILLACYNDRCSVEEISLQIGVAVPYLEHDLKALCEKDVLVKKGGKYETAIVIMTKEFLEESYAKTLPEQQAIADIIGRCLDKHLADVKAIGFHRGNLDDSLLRWFVMRVLLDEAGTNFSKNIKISTNYAGIEAVIFGSEFWPDRPGGMRNSIHHGAGGDDFSPMDFSAKGTYDCAYFDLSPNRVRLIFDIARGKSAGFSDNDMIEVAEFIRLGFVSKSGDKLSLNFPILTAAQLEELRTLLGDMIAEITEKMAQTARIATEILLQHTPASLRKEAEEIGWTNARICASMPVKIMVDNGTLRRAPENTHPTSFVVLQ